MAHFRELHLYEYIIYHLVIMRTVCRPSYCWQIACMNIFHFQMSVDHVIKLACSSHMGAHQGLSGWLVG